jgi:hypothetical protein
MWTKEAPKEPGFYWFRYPQMTPIYRDDNPTIVRVLKPLYDGGPVQCAFPGNEECPHSINIPGDPEWWSERIISPSEHVLFDGFFAPKDFPDQMARIFETRYTCLVKQKSVQSVHEGDVVVLPEYGRLWVRKIGPPNTDGSVQLECSNRPPEWLAFAPVGSEPISPPGGQMICSSADMPSETGTLVMPGRAESQRAAGLRTIAKPGEPGYKEPAQ